MDENSTAPNNPAPPAVILPTPPAELGTTVPSKPTDLTGVGRSEFDTLKNIIYAILVIVALGFLSLLWTAFHERAMSYDQLLQQVYILQGEVSVHQ